MDCYVSDQTMKSAYVLNPPNFIDEWLGEELKTYRGVWRYFIVGHVDKLQKNHKTELKKNYNLVFACYPKYIEEQIKIQEFLFIFNSYGSISVLKNSNYTDKKYKSFSIMFKDVKMRDIKSPNVSAHTCI